MMSEQRNNTPAGAEDLVRQIDGLLAAEHGFHIGAITALLAAGADPWRVSQDGRNALEEIGYALKHKTHALGAGERARVIARVLVPHMFAKKYWQNKDPIEREKAIAAAPEAYREYAALADGNSLPGEARLTRYEFAEDLHTAASYRPGTLLPLLQANPEIRLDHLQGKALELIQMAMNGVIANGTPEELAALLDAGAPLEGHTFPLLSVAAAHDNLSMMDVLLKRGADLETHDMWGRTALVDACIRHHLRATAYLLQKGANPWSQDRQRRTPLQNMEDERASRNNLTNAEKNAFQATARLLVPAMFAARYWQDQPALEKDIALERVPEKYREYAALADGGSLPGGSRYTRYEFACHLAELAEQGQGQALIDFLRENPGFNVKTLPSWEINKTLRDLLYANEAAALEAMLDWGINAHQHRLLSQATRLGRLPVMDMLLKRGGNADETNDWDETLLMVAAKDARADIVIRLLAAGADPWRKSGQIPYATPLTTIREIMAEAPDTTRNASWQATVKPLVCAMFGMKHFSGKNLGEIKKEIAEALPPEWQPYANWPEINRTFAPQTLPPRLRAGPGAGRG